MLIVYLFVVCEKVWFHESLADILQIIYNPEIMGWETASDLSASRAFLVSPFYSDEVLRVD